MISEIDRQMLNIITSAIHNQGIEQVSSEDWQRIYKELSAHAVYALPAPIIDKIELSKDERIEFAKRTGKNIQHFYSILSEQSAVLACLERENIPSVILKGTAAAFSYPHPEYRCMGDIDILVLKETFERAYQALCAAGYKPRQTTENFYRHIVFDSESGMRIELHNNYSSGDNEQQNSILDKLLYSAITKRDMAKISAFEFPMLPPLENGVVLLAHINQHLRGGLGLRQIIDWMCYVERYLDDSMWLDRFEAVAEQIGMRKLAVTVTAMCQKYLGLSSNITWCEYDPICDELMDYVLAHGNFGIKTGSKQNTTVQIIGWFRNPIRGLLKAQEYGQRTWDACNKHKWLKPFAWIYQIIRWIRHGLARGVNLKSLQRGASIEQVETDLLERLEVTRK